MLLHSFCPSIFTAQCLAKQQQRSFMPNGHREPFRVYQWNETAGHYRQPSEIHSSDSEETFTHKGRHLLLRRRIARAWKRAVTLLVRHPKMTRSLTVNRLVPKPIDEASVVERIGSYL